MTLLRHVAQVGRAIRQRDTAASAFPRKCRLSGMTGWGGRIRTSGTRNQNPLPYHLATPQLPSWGWAPSPRGSTSTVPFRGGPPPYTRSPFGRQSRPAAHAFCSPAHVAALIRRPRLRGRLVAAIKPPSPDDALPLRTRRVYPFWLITVGRSVAQPGSALASGARGREFESPRSDHF